MRTQMRARTAGNASSEADDCGEGALVLIRTWSTWTGCTEHVLRGLSEPVKVNSCAELEARPHTP